MLTMIYMTRIQNMPFFLLKVNNPSVRHPVWPVGHSAWPPSGPVGHLVWPLSSGHPRLATLSGHPVWPPPSGPRPAAVGSKKNKINKIFILFFWVVVAGWKRGQKIFQFSIPKIPKIPKFPEFPEFLEFPELHGLRGRSREKKKVFLA
jgi:hypothetical protein